MNVQADACVAPVPSRRERQMRLLLVGAHSLYHNALKCVIESRSSHCTVSHAVTEQEALRALSDIDLVLLDTDLDVAGESRLRSLAAFIKEVAPRPVLLISAGVRREGLQRLLREGIAGVVLKASRCETLLQAIELASNGKVWLERDVLGRVFPNPEETMNPSSEASRIAGLTSREREIISVACTGLTNRQIAARLSSSEATIRHHLSSIFAKLGVSSRAELIGFAYQNDIANHHAPASPSHPPQ